MVTMLQVSKTTRYLLVDKCKVLGASYLRETSSVGIFLRDCIWWWLSAWLHCSGSVLLFQ